MRRSLFFIIVGLGGAAILVALGVWQVQRLAWKEAIIADINTRIAAAPVDLPPTVNAEDDAYLPVAVTGSFDAGEVHVLVSQKDVQDQAAAVQWLDYALQLEPSHREALQLKLEIYSDFGDWPQVTQILGTQFQYASSPEEKIDVLLRRAALYRDTLIVNWDHEGQSFLVAFDKRTGEERWKVGRDGGTSWTTPIIAEHGGNVEVGDNTPRGTRFTIELPC